MLRFSEWEYPEQSWRESSVAMVKVMSPLWLAVPLMLRALTGLGSEWTGKSNFAASSVSMKFPVALLSMIVVELDQKV